MGEKLAGGRRFLGGRGFARRATCVDWGVLILVPLRSDPHGLRVRQVPAVGVPSPERCGAPGTRHAISRSPTSGIAARESETRSPPSPLGLGTRLGPVQTAAGAGALPRP